MEKRITVHNPTAMPIYVGSNMVPPGETRDFPESTVPPHLRPQDDAAPADAPAASDPLADLLGGTVKAIVAALPTLPNENIARLEALESAAESPRKGLMAALAEEKLKRAAAQDPAGEPPAGEPGN